MYEAAVTRYAPLDQEAAITNTATVTGGGLAAPLTAQATWRRPSGRISPSARPSAPPPSRRADS
ncbi:MAG: hypothetical protein ACLR39_00575 [Oscillospiraceae bacterium]